MAEMVNETLVDVWHHPGIGVGWGLAFLGILLCAGLALAGRVSWAEAAAAALISVGLAIGLGLIIFGIRDCASPSGFEFEDGILHGECARWASNGSTVLLGLPVSFAAMFGLVRLTRTIVDARACVRAPIHWQTPVRAIIAIVSAVLLLSYGAQVVAAPITVPALWWAARGARPATRALLGLVAALTMAVVGAVIGTVGGGGRGPLNWTLPILLFAATLALFARTASPRHGPSPDNTPKS